MFLFNFCSAALRAVGDSKTPLVAMIAASLTNIALDCVAVFGLGWGIAGAAGATVVAQCVAVLVCLHRLRRTPELHFGRAELRPDAALCRELLGLGAPIAGKNIIISLGGMTVQSVVNGFDMSFIAGFTATGKLYGLLEIAAVSFGFAVSTYVGQNYGARQYRRIRSGMRTALALAIGTAVAVGVLMFVLGRDITMLFIAREDPVLAAAAGTVAYHYLCCMGAFLPMLYLIYLLQAALQSMGDTVSTVVFGILEFVLRVGLALIVRSTGWQYGIFAAEVAAWTGAAIYLLVQFLRCMKKLPREGA